MRSLYFAYGSNMAEATLAERGVTAHRIGPVELPGYRLAFSLPSRRWTGRAADIRPARGASVWGVLWDLAEPGALDGYEANYDRLGVDVRHDSGTFAAFTYTVKPERRAAQEGAPAPAYLERMLLGARVAGLPDHYLADLRRLG